MKKCLFSLALIFISALSFSQTYKVGDKLESLDGNYYVPVTVLKVENGKYFVHWETGKGYDDQWLTAAELRKIGTYSVGDHLEGLETDGLWYAITILKAGEGKYFIHWEGFLESYDRWLEAENIRMPERKISFGNNRISIVYIENKTGAKIEYKYSGDGASGGNWINNGQKDSIKNAPIGGDIYVDGVFWITITKAHEGQTIIVK